MLNCHTYIIGLDAQDRAVVWAGWGKGQNPNQTDLAAEVEEARKTLREVKIFAERHWRNEQ